MRLNCQVSNGLRGRRSDNLAADAFAALVDPICTNLNAKAFDDEDDRSVPYWTREIATLRAQVVTLRRGSDPVSSRSFCEFQRACPVYHHPPIVLLVDDQQETAAMNAIGLLAMGFQPVTAETAEDAFARACQLRPDVIVTDVALADASGIELTRLLRSDMRTRDAGIIGLTGQSLGTTKREAKEAGCDRFLLKPCLPYALAWEIREVLNDRQAVR